MAGTADLLNFVSLTDLINKVKSPNSFVKEMVFGDHRSQETEFVEFGIKLGEREVAPFVRKGGQAVMVGGYNTKSRVLSPANISLKRPFSPEVMERRRPGFDPVFASGQDQQKIGRQALADDVQRMGDLIANAEEYLACQALGGVVSYVSAEMENFEVDFLRSASHNIGTLNPTAVWSDQTNSRIFDDLEAVKELHSTDEGLPVTDAIMGMLAAKALRNNTLVKEALATSLSLYKVGAGLTLVSQWTAQGALFLGELCGIRLWAYTRQVALPDGSTADLIPQKVVHFVSNVPSAEFRMYYGAIAEIVGQEPVMFVGERFSKSEIVVDPPQIVQYAKSRPMPCLRKPNATSSMQVLA